MQHDNDNYLPRTREEARKIGTDKYFTGNPCVNGHIAERDTKGGRCQECNRERARKWSAEFPEKKREQNLTRYWRNPEARRQSAREYASAHRKEACERAKKWREDHPERASANDRTKRARKRGAGGRHNDKDVIYLLEKQKYRCAYCRKSVRRKDSRHVDHIMPLKLGGSNDRSNLQILCVTCNTSKKATHPLDYAKRIGLLC